MKYLSKENLIRRGGKTALVRIDLNIEGGSKNYFRIDAVLPTVELLLKNGIKVVILSHRGRPSKQTQKDSLRPFQKIITKRLKEDVLFIKNPLEKGIREFVKKSSKRVFLVENLRFWPGEETNSPIFAKKLAIFGDFYVNDGFPVSHRTNASISAITRFLPSYTGLQFEKEIKNLDNAIKNFKPPLIFVLGGIKTIDKLSVLNFFKNRADKFLLGGGPSTTFFAAQGLPIGDSLYDKNMDMKPYLKNKKIILPIDTMIENKKILDIGPKTAKIYSDIIKKSKTIIWSGPMGVFENKKFAGGTKSIWEAIFYASRNNNAKAIVGGEETVASLQLLTHNKKQETGNGNLFLSTGGGAMLEYLAGEKMPGIEALEKNQKNL